jgi:hypothetical protein
LKSGVVMITRRRPIVTPQPLTENGRIFPNDQENYSVLTQGLASTTAVHEVAARRPFTHSHQSNSASNGPLPTNPAPGPVPRLLRLPLPAKTRAVIASLG